ncbi:dienelactone hydrolase [Flavobacterium rivuli WB 3.3-2 = DSM 21788]|uniref:Dienelactone hydrolase n=1 Tax=Flavobacterium rivuli WB 3.3-2 = DSM 21788 TaxID=1121895 RepID=A0A0A2MEQ2_9FLAO|nr:dienelactone hydrolase family protein [Flavobacterium rivuli]KGO86770.1 dienelactone hydrolase [Flavobacterium rivuli WB 3.3-2 = DSM 21788]
MKKLIALTLIFMATQLQAQLKPVAYTEGGQKLNGFAATPAKALKNKPGILILPAWMGINTHSKEVATELSKLGYHAFVADIYGEGKYPKSTQEAGQQAGYYKGNPEAYQKRISAALEALIKSGADANNIVVIGYCFGGTGALEAARAGLNVKGVVSFHGGLGKDASRANGAVKPKVLVLHGADDPHVPQKEIDGFITEMKDAKADWQLVYLSNAVHAFTEKEAGNDNSKGAAYNEKADKRSWAYFMDFLNEIFAAK